MNEENEKEFRDFGGMTFDEYLKECEEMNPGSTGYTSDYD